MTRSMSGLRAVARAIPRATARAIARTAVTALVASAMAISGAWAQGAATDDADAFAPVEEYARKVEDFTRSAPGLTKKIEDSTKAIDGLADAPKARSELEQLKAAVADLLGRVSDNGELARLGARALERARSKLKALEHDTRFKPDERDFLVERWRDLTRQTERAADDLEAARQQFVELVKTLQTREDFIDELLQIKRAADAIKVMRQLTGELRDASEKLKTLIGGIRPPGA